MLAGTAEMADNSQRVGRVGRYKVWMLQKRLSELSAQVEVSVLEARQLIAWRQTYQPLAVADLTEEDRRMLDHNRRVRLTEVVQRHCTGALKSITQHKWAFPFNNPVDVSRFLDYPKVVSQPMDFSTIRARQDGGYYRDPKDWWSDIMLVFANAKRYNAPGSDCFLMAQTLQEVSEEKYEKLIAPRLAEEAVAAQRDELHFKRKRAELVNQQMGEAMEAQCAMLFSLLAELHASIREAKAMAASLCEPLTLEEKQALAATIQGLPTAQLESIVAFVASRHPPSVSHSEVQPGAGGTGAPSRKVQLNLGRYDPLLLRQLQHLVSTCCAATRQQQQQQGGGPLLHGQQQQQQQRGAGSAPAAAAARAGSARTASPGPSAGAGPAGAGPEAAAAGAAAAPTGQAGGASVAAASAPAASTGPQRQEPAAGGPAPAPPGTTGAAGAAAAAAAAADTGAAGAPPAQPQAASAGASGAAPPAAPLAPVACPQAAAPVSSTQRNIADVVTNATAAGISVRAGIKWPGQAVGAGIRPRARALLSLHLDGPASAAEMATACPLPRARGLKRRALALMQQVDDDRQYLTDQQQQQQHDAGLGGGVYDMVTPLPHGGSTAAEGRRLQHAPANGVGRVAPFSADVGAGAPTGAPDASPMEGSTAAAGSRLTLISSSLRLLTRVLLPPDLAQLMFTRAHSAKKGGT
ncbi:Transcription factor GTE1 [Tetrabaena socialis]|uniref:Transcription factor GTE1 n=1 Tax=Tetrabaena socialis TaxID=47790 RepID=A0A2J8AHZ3_9CHLO|nr:Transcription factor GTE1 [Tetrabaena socialis]|eukprot:PNH12130.1 Transcription factor GTE1 [Tetrabaena socialis]